jgi:5-methylcytosine-specific restriction endonuclease McrA
MKKFKLKHPPIVHININVLPDNYVNWNSIFITKKWKKIRKTVLRICKYRCLRCNKKTELCIDHIVPRSKNKTIEYDICNLQVLCKTCNKYKYTKVIDYRTIGMIHKFNSIKYKSIHSMYKKYIV